jgi:hypothetical protein
MTKVSEFRMGKGRTASLENIKQKFPQELQDLLSFEVQDEGAIIKPRQFLGSENFVKIADIVKAHGGDYVSAGKESHFRIPVSAQETPQVPEKVPASPPTDLHFKVTKLSVGFGTTIQQSEIEWSKQNYGVEVEVSSDVRDIVEKAKAEAEQLVRSWLTEPVLPATGIPQVDIDELNACEWLTFKKEPAKPGQAAWVKNPIEFTNWANPPNVLLQLAKALKRNPDEKLVLGDMEYSFSGKGDMAKHFISRKPVKTETAK